MKSTWLRAAQAELSDERDLARQLDLDKANELRLKMSRLRRKRFNRRRRNAWCRKYLRKAESFLNH